PGTHELGRVVRRPRRPVSSQIAGEGLLAPGYLGGRDDRRERGDAAVKLRVPQREHERAVPAHRMAEDAAHPGLNRKVPFDEGWQLARHVAVHPVRLPPRLLGGVHVESGTLPEIPARVVTQIAHCARARVACDEHEAERGGHALRSRLDGERFFGAGEAGEIVERGPRRARIRGNEHGEAHGPAGGGRLVAIKALDATEAALLRHGFDDTAHENSITVRMDSPACIKSNASLMRSSGSLWVMRLSMSIFPSMYQSTMRGTSVRPHAPPNALPRHTRPVTS